MEEMDPLERMRRRYGLDAAAAAAAEQRRMHSVPIPSLEEELLRTQRKVNIRDFDYVPVPRTEDEES